MQDNLRRRLILSRDDRGDVHVVSAGDLARRRVIGRYRQRCGNEICRQARGNPAGRPDVRPGDRFAHRQRNSRVQGLLLQLLQRQRGRGNAVCVRGPQSDHVAGERGTSRNVLRGHVVRDLFGC